MDASLQDLLVCLAIWSVPTALLGLVGLLGDRAGATPAGNAAGPAMAAGAGAPAGRRERAPLVVITGR